MCCFHEKNSKISWGKIPEITTLWRRHSVEKREIYSHWIDISSKLLFSTFFSKNVALTEFLPKKRESKFAHAQCEQWKIWSHQKIFRQIAYLVLSKVKTLLWRHFCQKSVRINFRIFHTACVWHTALWKFWNFTATILLQKFRQINFLLKKFTLKLIWRKNIAWQ